MNDDIAYIQGQGRGLQVQTQNQRALLNELEELLVSPAILNELSPRSLICYLQQTVQVDSDSLLALTQESLEQTSSIKNLETSVTVLYKALLAGRDRGTVVLVIHLLSY